MYIFRITLLIITSCHKMLQSYWPQRGCESAMLRIGAFTVIRPVFSWSAAAPLDCGMAAVYIIPRQNPPPPPIPVIDFISSSITASLPSHQIWNARHVQPLQSSPTSLCICHACHFWVCSSDSLLLRAASLCASDGKSPCVCGADLWPKWVRGIQFGSSSWSWEL